MCKLIFDWKWVWSHSQADTDVQPSQDSVTEGRQRGGDEEVKDWRGGKGEEGRKERGKKRPANGKV